MKTLAIATASILMVIAANAVFASDIYKWTDEDGNVHYGDRPNGEQQPERLAIASSRTDQAQILAAAEARAKSQAERAEAENAAAAGGPSPEELRAEAEERAKKCATVKSRLQQLVTSRRLYREDENGERVYLDETEKLAAREKVENQITEFCGP